MSLARVIPTHCRKKERSEPPIAALAKQDGDRISKQFLCGTWKKRNERPNSGGVSI